MGGGVLEETVGAVADFAVGFQAAGGAELPDQVEGGAHLGGCDQCDLKDSRKIGHHEVGEVLGEEVVGGRREQHEPP